VVAVRQRWWVPAVGCRKGFRRRWLGATDGYPAEEQPPHWISRTGAGRRSLLQCCGRDRTDLHKQATVALGHRPAQSRPATARDHDGIAGRQEGIKQYVASSAAAEAVSS
jgi:hypothetical protein